MFKNKYMNKVVVSGIGNNNSKIKVKTNCFRSAI